MDWNSGYSARYYASIVNTETWKDSEPFGFTSGSVSHSDSGLLESADINCREFDYTGEKWIRIYIDARQSGMGAREPIFTGLAVYPEVSIDGSSKEYSLECYSVLKPAEDVLLERGWYAPAKMNGAVLIKRLLSVTPAPVEIKGEAPALSKAIIAEDNETNLSMVWRILTAIGWRLRIRGDGTIVVCPVADEAAYFFDPIKNDSIEPKVSLKRDWFSCPNVLKVTQDDLTAVARDDSPNSPLSTVCRGREVWEVETSVDTNTGESLASYARRRLRECQAIGLSISYDRRFQPDLLVGDIVNLHYPEQGIEGPFRITSQKIELGYNGRTSEEVVQT